MKRLVILALAAVLAMGLLAGCGSDGVETADFGPETAAQELLESKAFSDILSPVTAKVAAALYGVKETDISACAVFCSTGATAEEIAIFKVQDENLARQLETAARARLKSQAAAYAGYGPQEVPKLEAADVRRQGVYVSCVVSADTEAAAAVMDKYMK